MKIKDLYPYLSAGTTIILSDKNDFPFLKSRNETEILRYGEQEITEESIYVANSVMGIKLKNYKWEE